MPVKKIKVFVDRKKSDLPGTHWSPEQKEQAVAQYLILGSFHEVGKLMGIPRTTLDKWHASDWWPVKEEEIRKQANQKLRGRLGKVVNKSIEAIEDRLDNGDFVYDPKSGKIKRIGVKASVANQISKDMIDRSIILDKIQQKSTISEESIEQRLKNLHEEFIKYAKAKTIIIEKEQPNELLQQNQKLISNIHSETQSPARSAESSSGSSTPESVSISGPPTN